MISNSWAYYALKVVVVPVVFFGRASAAFGQAGTVTTDSTVIRLTLAEARGLAQKQNPDLLAAYASPAIARGELQQARTVRFNPDLNLIGRLNPEVTLMQEIEWAGQRGLRTNAARSGLARAESETSEAGRRAMADVSIAYQRVIAASNRRQVIDQLGVLTDRLIAAVRIQLKEGEISTLDANLAEIENGRVRARALASRREATSVELELKRLLGLPMAVALRLSDDSSLAVPSVSLREDSLVATAERLRPDLAAATAATAEARALTSLARREALPNVRFGAVVEPGTKGGGVGLALGLSLPLLNRNRGVIAARDAEARQAELRLVATESFVRAQVAAALASYRIASEELRLYAETVLEPARSNAGLLDEAYRAGKIPLTSLLLLRNQLLDAEFGYWDAWLTRRVALIELEAATGVLTPPTPPTGAVPSARENSR